MPQAAGFSPIEAIQDPDDSRVLPGREMRRLRNATWKEELLRFEMSVRDPGSDRVSCLFGYLELHRSLSLRLHDNRARRHSTALHDIMDTKPNQIASAQFAVDGEAEQCEFACSMIKL